MGAVCGTLLVRSNSSSDETALHINFLKLKTVFLSLKRLPEVSETHILVQTETIMTQYLNQAGRTRSRSLDWLVELDASEVSEVDDCTKRSQYFRL